MSTTAHYRIVAEALESDAAFALFRLPGESQVHIATGVAERISLADMERIQAGFVAFPFAEKEGFLLRTSGTIPVAGSAPPLAHAAPQLSLTEYLDLCRIFVEATQGPFRKLALSRVQSVARKPEFALTALFDALSGAYPQAFVYVLNLPEEGCWAGATPELLLHLDPDNLETVALAGTRAWKGDHTLEAEWTAKEQEEHRWVADYIEECLLRHGISDYKRSQAQTVRAAQVLHLKTFFPARLPEGFKSGAFLEDLQPTPAVAGIPKAEAIDFIRRHEPHRRGLYTGFLGYSDENGVLDLFVNLRCMKITPSHTELYTGGGITFDSVPEKEWEETQLKAQTLLKFL